VNWKACWFGGSRQRLEQIPSIYDLVQKAESRYNEVRVIHGDWTRPLKTLPWLT
jgi:hypothetical protein